MESVAAFDAEYFVSHGIAEGAVQPFLLGVEKVKARAKREKKKAKVAANKENYLREESVEI